MTTTRTPLTEVTDDTFADVVLAADLPVIVDFWAAWCPPCHAVKPVLEEIATELVGRVRIVTIDTDANPVTPSSLRVTGLPTLKFFHAGTEIGSLTGARPKRALLEQIERVLERA